MSFLTRVLESERTYFQHALFVSRFHQAPGLSGSQSLEVRSGAENKAARPGELLAPSPHGLVGSFGLYSRRITEPFLLSPHKTLPNRRVTASPRRVPAVMKEPRRGGPHSVSASLGSRTFSTFISGCAGIAFGSSPCTCGVTASPAHTGFQLPSFPR